MDEFDKNTLHGSLKPLEVSKETAKDANRRQNSFDQTETLSAQAQCGSPFNSSMDAAHSSAQSSVVPQQGIRVRFGFRVPIFGNAFIVVGYLKDESAFHKYEDAANNLRALMLVFGHPELAAMIVYERS